MGKSSGTRTGLNGVPAARILISKSHLSEEQFQSSATSSKQSNTTPAKMKVLGAAVLALVILTVDANPAVKERNLRGAMTMHYSEAHKAVSTAHFAMEARNVHDEPTQKGKQPKPAKKHGGERDYSSGEPKLPVPMKDGMIDIPAVIAALKSRDESHPNDCAKKSKHAKAAMGSKNVFSELAALKAKLSKKKKAAKPGVMEAKAAATKGDKTQLSAMEGNLGIWGDTSISQQVVLAKQRVNNILHPPKNKP